MTRHRKNVPIIKTCNGVIKIPVFKDILLKNPSILESFINPGIVRFAVIEVPEIEDLLYQVYVDAMNKNLL